MRAITASARHQASAGIESLTMIDHTGVSLSDFAQNKAFYSQALAPKPEDCGAFVLDPHGHNMEAKYHGSGRA